MAINNSAVDNFYFESNVGPTYGDDFGDVKGYTLTVDLYEDKFLYHSTQINGIKEINTRLTIAKISLIAAAVLLCLGGVISGMALICLPALIVAIPLFEGAVIVHNIHLVFENKLTEINEKEQHDEIDNNIEMNVSEIFGRTIFLKWIATKCIKKKIEQSVNATWYPKIWGNSVPPVYTQGFPPTGSQPGTVYEPYEPYDV